MEHLWQTHGESVYEAGFLKAHEISFNKYFYRHKPLRGLDKVTADILALEAQADGLISDILGVPVAALSEVE